MPPGEDKDRERGFKEESEGETAGRAEARVRATRLGRAIGLGGEGNEVRKLG
jgi:hypothetical protein